MLGGQWEGMAVAIVLQAEANSADIDIGTGYWTYYAHNSSLLVQAGESVVQGQTIALSGSTGNSTGDHLDFRIRQGRVFLNPLEFLP